MFKELSDNIPLVETLEKRPGYSNFMKDFVTKKWAVGLEPTSNMNHYFVVASKLLVEKKDGPRAFTIPCTIGSFNFARALCNLGVSINLIPLVVYKKLGLGYLN